MLLTIPWFLSIVMGRVDIDSITGKPRYKAPKLTPPDKLNLYSNGVAVTEPSKQVAYFVIATSVTYILIEGSALAFRNQSDDLLSQDEVNYAISSFALCVVFLIVYLIYAFIASDSDDAQMERDDKLREGIKSGKISLVAVVAAVMSSSPSPGSEPNKSNEESGQLINDAAWRRLRYILRPFYDKYDADSSNSINASEVTLILQDLGENMQSSGVKSIIKEFFKDAKSTLQYDEFVMFCFKYANDQPNANSPATENKVAVRSDDEEESEDLPEEFASLSPEEQQYNIKMKSAWMMLLGTAVVVIFSDPIVACLSEIGSRLGIRAFFVAFLIIPFISNGSELVASINHSSKKTTMSISTSMAALLGAAVMNNTLVLGVFMALVFSRVRPFPLVTLLVYSEFFYFLFTFRRVFIMRFLRKLALFCWLSTW